MYVLKAESSNGLGVAGRAEVSRTNSVLVCFQSKITLKYLVAFVFYSLLRSVHRRMTINALRELTHLSLCLHSYFVCFFPVWFSGGKVEIFRVSDPNVLHFIFELAISYQT